MPKEAFKPIVALRFINRPARSGSKSYISTWNLSAKQNQMIEDNIASAFVVLKDHCHIRKIRFDLVPEDYLKAGVITEDRVACE